MSLNNIHIPEILVSELYRDTLLATSTPPVIAAPTAIAQVAVPTPPAAAASPTAPSPAAAPAQVVAAPPAATTAAAPPSSPAKVTPAAAPATPPGYKFLGSNRRKITILVQSPGIAFLPDDQLAVLTKMLEACRLNMGDVAIVNHAAAPVTITALRQQLQPSIVLLFGLSPLEIQLPVSFPVFKIQAYDQSTYLCAPSLEELVGTTDESKLLKSKLWVCLKSLFEI